jgi:hypothetical protein
MVSDETIDEYLDYRHYYDELVILFEGITNEKFNGEPISFLIVAEEDIARNIMNMDANIHAMTKEIFKRIHKFQGNIQNKN